jgi:hypothetical protein
MILAALMEFPLVVSRTFVVRRPSVSFVVFVRRATGCPPGVFAFCSQARTAAIRVNRYLMPAIRLGLIRFVE